MSDWVKEKPQKPGAYKVRGFNLFCPKKEQVEALVEVIKKSGKLLCNLHCSNSSGKNSDDWDLLKEYDNDFEWYGPLVLRAKAQSAQDGV